MENNEIERNISNSNSRSNHEDVFLLDLQDADSFARALKRLSRGSIASSTSIRKGKNNNNNNNNNKNNNNNLPSPTAMPTASVRLLLPLTPSSASPASSTPNIQYRAVSADPRMSLSERVSEHVSLSERMSLSERDPRSDIVRSPLPPIPPSRQSVRLTLLASVDNENDKLRHTPRYRSSSISSSNSDNDSVGDNNNDDDEVDNNIKIINDDHNQNFVDQIFSLKSQSSTTTATSFVSQSRLSTPLPSQPPLSQLKFGIVRSDVQQQFPQRSPLSHPSLSSAPLFSPRRLSWFNLHPQQLQHQNLPSSATSTYKPQQPPNHIWTKSVIVLTPSVLSLYPYILENFIDTLVLPNSDHLDDRYDFVPGMTGPFAHNQSTARFCARVLDDVPYSVLHLDPNNTVVEKYPLRNFRNDVNGDGYEDDDDMGDENGSGSGSGEWVVKVTGLIGERQKRRSGSVISLWLRNQQLGDEIEWVKSVLYFRVSDQQDAEDWCDDVIEMITKTQILQDFSFL
ncbi:hypothetical protein HK100_001148 [Physocladia obscura]|uniref:Uncharacterized protein n=1 Tax=Physocladia obscura TaxID=109957 RepID=A0AAD5T3C0_9FUNG|nr:hypothetical protein HK100_001148 [Physocladia obscura]